MRSLMPFFVAVAVAVNALAAEPDADIPPIAEIKNIAPNPDVFTATKRGQPLVLKTADEAAKYFGEDALATLKESVDFDRQIVLLFAWRGSGQDKLTHDVAESFPEQVTFAIIPGRTRDLRPHVHAFALRSNVKWSVGK
mgnify:CR=1 FL=1